MMKVRARLLVAVAALGAALGGFWLATQLDRGAPHLASGTWLPRPRAVQDFSLTDERGRAVHPRRPGRHADSGVLRFHALPGRVPDDAGEARAGQEERTAARRCTCCS